MIKSDVRQIHVHRLMSHLTRETAMGDDVSKKKGCGNETGRLSRQQSALPLPLFSNRVDH